MTIEHSITSILLLLFGDSNAIEQGRLSSPMTAELKGNDLKAGDGKLMIIESVTAPSLKGNVRFGNDGDSLVNVTADEEVVAVNQVPFFCREVDAIGLDDASSPVTITYREYTRA